MNIEPEQLSDDVALYQGDCLASLRSMDSESVQCCVTSPPYYGLRDYGHSGQIGLESTPDEYVGKMVDVFREVRRVLRDDGTLWLNLGDSYAAQGGAHGNRDDNQTGVGAKRLHLDGAGDKSPRRSPDGLKPKDLIGIPWRVAFALQSDGWYLRQDIIWHKPNPMPESVRDRCTKAHEYVFLLAKSAKYFYDADAVKEPLADANSQRTTAKYNTASRYGAGNGGNGGLDALASRMRSGDVTHRNRRSVWTVTPKPYKGAHFAVMPPELVRPCVLAGSRRGDTILDPFGGSGTVGCVAVEEGRKAVLCELNPTYCGLIWDRMKATTHVARPRLFDKLEAETCVA